MNAPVLALCVVELVAGVIVAHGRPTAIVLEPRNPCPELVRVVLRPRLVAGVRVCPIVRRRP